jgi:hypothetical protein
VLRWVLACERGRCSARGTQVCRGGPATDVQLLKQTSRFQGGREHLGFEPSVTVAQVEAYATKVNDKRLSGFGAALFHGRDDVGEDEDVVLAA